MKGESPNEVNNNETISNNNDLPLMFKDKIVDKKIKRNYVSLTILNK